MSKVGQPAPHMSPDIQNQIEDHCFSTTTEEVGGFLVGRIEDSGTNISGALRAKGAQASQVSMTFTHESWEDAFNTVQEKFPGDSIVGWYHSHPGFGLFLSGHDAFIQQNFFVAEGQVALVVDPVEGALGWFYYDGTEIREISHERTIHAPEAKASSATSTNSRRPSKTSLALASAIAVVLGLLAGWLLGSRQGNQTVQALDNQVKELQSQPSAQPSPARQQTGATQKADVIYTVQPGDTLTRIAISIGGGQDSLDAIIKANPDIKPNELSIGQKIRVPLGNDQ